MCSSSGQPGPVIHEHIHLLVLQPRRRASARLLATTAFPVAVPVRSHGVPRVVPYVLRHHPLLVVQRPSARGVRDGVLVPGRDHPPRVHEPCAIGYRRRSSGWITNDADDLNDVSVSVG